MNYTILKDVKTIAGFISSLMLSVIAVALAANDNDFWVFFLFVSLAVSALSAVRANKIYKEDNGD